MRGAAIVLVLVLVLEGCSPTTPVASPTTPHEVATTMVEPCPEPDPVPTRVMSQRYESRTIGVESRAPKYVGRPIDLDLKDADIGNVCRLLADVGKVNIVLADGVQGSVTLSMRRVPWDQALAAVIEAKNLDAEREGNVIIVRSRK